MRQSTYIFLLPVFLMCTSCAIFKPSQDLADSRELLPETFNDTASTNISSSLWWQDFDNADLNTLIPDALDGNLTLAQADARLRQAKATAQQAGAMLLPEINLSGGTGYTRQHTENPAVPGTPSTTDSEQYSLGGGVASYEVDLWGRVRSTRNAARGQYQASIEDVATAVISVSADLADAWFQLLEMQAQSKLLNKQLKTNHTLVELLRHRQLRSRSTALDVYQQQQTTAATEALIPQVAMQLTILSNSINILQGKPIDHPISYTDTELPDLPPFPDLGLPADLLTNRPDIQAARLRLEAAGWNLAAAKADQLPAIRLSGTATYQSDKFDELFDNWLLNIAASLTAPLFDGGRRRAEVERQKAVLDEQLAIYKLTVMNAVAEVDNAIQQEKQQQVRLGALEQQLDYANKALYEAQRRYRNGRIDYLNVLTALTSVQKLERQVISAKRVLLSYRIGLYRSLGGSWMHQHIDREI